LVALVKKAVHRLYQLYFSTRFESPHTQYLEVEKGKIGEGLAEVRPLVSARSAARAGGPVPLRTLVNATDLAELASRIDAQGLLPKVVRSLVLATVGRIESIAERRLAETYRGYADALNDGWPRTADMLQRISDTYDSWARREDVEAELREDL